MLSSFSSISSLRGALASPLVNTPRTHLGQVKLSGPSITNGPYNYTSLIDLFTYIDTDGTGQHLVSLTYGTTIYYSSDYGQTFYETVGSRPNSLATVSVANSAPYVLIGGSGGISLSTDYGKTCAPIKSMSNKNFVSVSLSDNGQYAYAALSSNSYLYSSSNYSQSFQLLNESAYQDTYRGVTTSSTGQYVYAIGKSGNVYSSSDYGNSWTKFFSSIYPDFITTSSDGKYVVIASSSYKVSSDYGVTYGDPVPLGFSPTEVAVSSNGQYIVFNDPQTTIYISSDYGKTVNQTTSGYQNWMGVSISSSGQYVYAAAYGGYITQSTNYGSSWSPVCFFWIDVATSQDGKISYAITNAEVLNVVYRTTDGGITWNMLDNLSEYPYYSIACDGNCVNIAIIADRNILLQSSNSGSSWTSKFVASPYAYLYDITISQSGQYMALCMNNGGGIFYSDDYGASWKQSNAPSTSWISITSSASGQYVVSNSDNYIYSSNDYGITWNILADNSITSWLSISSDSTSQNLIASSYNLDVIYYSHDNGTTWSESNSISRYWLSPALSSSGKIGYAAALNGYYTYESTTGFIFTSTDYGVTWNKTSLPQRRWISVDCDSTGQFVVATIYNGEVFTSSDYGVSWMEANITITSYNTYVAPTPSPTYASSVAPSYAPTLTPFSSSSDSLSDGAIAGIVVGSLFGLALLIGIVLLFLLYFGIITSTSVAKNPPMAKELQM